MQLCQQCFTAIAADFSNKIHYIFLGRGQAGPTPVIYYKI